MSERNRISLDDYPELFMLMEGRPWMEYHNIPPLYNEKSEILILGSFPSVKSREGQFFYHHPQNRYWKVMAAVFGCRIPETIEEKKQMILSNHAAMWDVISGCEITGSSDSSIKNVVPNDIGRLLKESEIRRIYTNGGTAHKYYQRYIKKEIGWEDIPLPSTSPANAQWTLDRLIEVWKEKITIFEPVIDFATDSCAFEN